MSANSSAVVQLFLFRRPGSSASDAHTAEALRAASPIFLFSLSSYISSLRAGYRHRVCSSASHTQLWSRRDGEEEERHLHGLIECARSRRWSRWRVSHLASWCSCGRADAEEQSSGGVCAALPSQSRVGDGR
ncbi:hypothetical protein B0H11DRAFT_2293961 [Mycena galericulata]|nr:hypothetical protein B0H11DRAFT_2293961 [Mycena galericulata]